MTDKPKQKVRKNQNSSSNSNSPLEGADSRLKEEYKLREQTMAANLLAIEQNNAFLIELLKRLQQLNLKAHRASVRSEINEIINLIQTQVNNKNLDHLEQFYLHANNNFIKSLTTEHPNLTPTEKRLCILLQMNLSTKEISEITMQRCEAIEMARHRLRIKLGLDREDNLKIYLATFQQ